MPVILVLLSCVRPEAARLRWVSWQPQDMAPEWCAAHQAAPSDSRVAPGVASEGGAPIMRGALTRAGGARSGHGVARPSLAWREVRRIVVATVSLAITRNLTGALNPPCWFVL